MNPSDNERLTPKFASVCWLNPQLITCTSFGHPLRSRDLCNTFSTTASKVCTLHLVLAHKLFRLQRTSSQPLPSSRTCSSVFASNQSTQSIKRQIASFRLRLAALRLVYCCLLKQIRPSNGRICGGDHFQGHPNVSFETGARSYFDFVLNARDAVAYSSQCF